MKKFIPIAIASLALYGCGGGGDGGHGPDDGHDHGAHAHPDHGPHGGELVEVGDHLAHLEVLHDPAKQMVTVHVLATDAKTPQALTSAPKLNLITKDGNVQVAMEGSGSTFTGTHASLAGEPEGRIALELNGKSWQVEMAHHHDHDGHDHGDHGAHKDGDDHDHDGADHKGHDHKPGDDHHHDHPPAVEKK